jgi:predicted transposase YbfD/YdcC
MKGYAAIGGWVADVPPPVLADLYIRAGAVPSPPPSKTTIRRVLTDAGAWLMNLAGLSTPAAAGEDGSRKALTQVRLDGKTIRGARDADGKQVRLLAAMIVGKKTNEVPMAKAVLARIDLVGKVVTADALHAVKATANYIRERGGEFILPVKENRRALFDTVSTLPWEQAPVAHAATDKGHGGSPPAPSRSCPPPTASRSCTSARSS